MIKPVIVRDRIYKGAYYAFMPADDTGKFWWRMTFGWTSVSAPGNTHYPMLQLIYGEVHPGLRQGALDASADSSPPWTLVEVYGWQNYHTMGQGRWKEWDIPDGHNRISLVVRTRSTYGNITISLGSTSGGTQYNDQLLMTDLDLADNGLDDWIDNGMTEVVIATNSTGTGRKLRLTAADTDDIHVAGVISFDTDGSGDPSTVIGNTYGHDIIIKHDSSDGAFVQRHQVWGAISDAWVLTARSNSTIEFAMRWGAVKKFSSYGPSHYNEYRYQTTTIATLYIDQVSQGTMEDTANVALGELHEDELIAIYNAGWLDYDNDGVRDAEDLIDIVMWTSITSNGIGHHNAFKFTGAASVDILYNFCLSLDDSVTGGKIEFPPDQTKTIIAASGTSYNISGAIISEIYPTGIDCVIRTASSGPNFRIFESSSILKQYHDSDLTILTTPANGVVWNTSSFLTVKKKPMRFGSLVGKGLV